MANQQDFDNLSKKQIVNIHEEIIFGCLSLFLNFLHTFIHTKAHNTIALMLYCHHKDLSIVEGCGLRNCQSCGKSL